MNTRDSIFISYSHKDEKWAARFNQMLDTQRNEIRVFRDAGIVEGEDWESRLQGELCRAKIALLLVSPDFANSEFITNRELPWILKAQKDGLVVNWVEVRPTIVPDELKKFQAFKIQSSDRSLSQLHGGDQDVEIKKISEIVIEAVEKRSNIPRWELFNRVSDAVQRRFGYSVRREVAIGDHSVIYTADAPGDRVIVKAHVRQLFSDDRREDLRGTTRELETAKTLKHPAFIRLFDWALDTEPQIIVTEFVDARPIGKIMPSRERRLNVDQVRFILQVIAEALAEYHQANLVYDNLRPSDVLLEKRDDVTWYPRISAFRASQISHKLERVTRKFEINPERLTYVVPEQYEKDTVTHKTDQYSLGLLAIEMLQGRPPVQVNQLKDLVDKTNFFEDPEAYGGEWLTRSPTLTRIILRMLELSPNKRWQSMAALAAVLGGKASVRENNRRLAKESYKRLADEQEDFFRAFYKNLFTRKKSLKSKFPGDHDWKRQHAMLDDAVRGLLNFSETQGEDEPTIFTDTAKKHKNLKLTKKDFDAFEEAFIETLIKFNEGSEEMQGAWRACFAPGMSYMKKHATREPT